VVTAGLDSLPRRLSLQVLNYLLLLSRHPARERGKGKGDKRPQKRKEEKRKERDQLARCSAEV
jgi:hypothetical protein